jgi:transposase
VWASQWRRGWSQREAWTWDACRPRGPWRAGRGGPGNDAAAGKRRAGKTTQGRPSLRAAVVPAAWAASHSRGTSRAGQYPRLVKRRGKKTALVAVAPSMLVIVDHLWSRRTRYADLGENGVTPRSIQAPSQRLIRPLEALGFTGTVEERADAA